MCNDCQGNKKKSIQRQKRYQKSERFEPWSLKIDFSLFSKCIKSCVFGLNLLYICQVVLILATLLGKNFSAKETRIQEIV